MSFYPFPSRAGQIGLLWLALTSPQLMQRVLNRLPRERDWERARERSAEGNNLNLKEWFYGKMGQNPHQPNRCPIIFIFVNQMLTNNKCTIMASCCSPGMSSCCLTVDFIDMFGTSSMVQLIDVLSDDHNGAPLLAETGLTLRYSQVGWVWHLTAHNLKN